MRWGRREGDTWFRWIVIDEGMTWSGEIIDECVEKAIEDRENHSNLIALRAIYLIILCVDFHYCEHDIVLLTSID